MGGAGVTRFEMHVLGCVALDAGSMHRVCRNLLKLLSEEKYPQENLFFREQVFYFVCGLKMSHE